MALWPSCDFNFWRLVHPRQSIIMALWPSCDLNFWRFAILIVSIGILTIIAAGRPGLVTIHWIVPAKSNQSGFFVTYFGLLWTWPYDPEVDHFMHLTCGTLVTLNFDLMTPKLTISCTWPVEHLWQFAWKPLYSVFKILCSEVLQRMYRRTADKPSACGCDDKCGLQY